MKQCISSIANQTMKDIEIIAINDGSIDNDLNILDSMSQQYKGKIKIFDKEKGDASSARNIGIENAIGKFIKFVDADDYLGIDALNKISQENNVKLVRGNY